jgi:hypothetical protein
MKRPDDAKQSPGFQTGGSRFGAARLKLSRRETYDFGLDRIE